MSPVRLWFVGLPLLGLVLLITCHNTDVHLPIDGGSIKEGVWSFVDLPRRSRTKTIRPRPETGYEILQPLQDKVLLGTRKPLTPSAAFGVEPGNSFLTANSSS